MNLFSDPGNLRYRLTIIIPVLVFLTSLLSAFVSQAAHPHDSGVTYAMIFGIALFASGCAFLVCLGLTRPLQTLLRKAAGLVRLETKPSERGRFIEVYNLMEKLTTYLKSQGMAGEEEKGLLKDMERLDYLLPLGYMSLAVAHEVRNPLTTIRGMSELLMSKKPEPDEQRYLETILGAAGKIEAFTTQLLDLTDDVLASEMLDLNGLVEEAMADSMARFPGITWQFHKGDLPSVTGDRTKLYQVFQNIIKNAFEMEGEAGLVEVSSRAEGDVAIVTVYNRSSHIDPGDEQTIFKPFFTKRKGGKGLGLFIGLRNVRLHGGTIDVKSQNPGVTFVIKLPTAGAGPENDR